MIHITPSETTHELFVRFETQAHDAHPIRMGTKEYGGHAIYMTTEEAYILAVKLLAAVRECNAATNEPITPIGDFQDSTPNSTL